MKDIIPYLRRFYSGFLFQRPYFNPGLLNLRFLVYKKALDQISLRSIGLPFQPSINYRCKYLYYRPPRSVTV
jgi:hypothetical protein